MVVLVNAGPLFGFWMNGPLWLELETPQTVVTTDRACWGCIPGLPWFPGPAWLPAAPAGPHDSASLQKSKIHPGYFLCDKYHLRDINLKLILFRNLLLQENFPLYMYQFFWHSTWGSKYFQKRNGVGIVIVGNNEEMWKATKGKPNSLLSLFPTIQTCTLITTAWHAMNMSKILKDTNIDISLNVTQLSKFTQTYYSIIWHQMISFKSQPLPPQLPTRDK